MQQLALKVEVLADSVECASFLPFTRHAYSTLIVTTHLSCIVLFAASSENFRQLCTGEGPVKGFKGSKFHRIIPQVIPVNNKRRSSKHHAYRSAAATAALNSYLVRKERYPPKNDGCVK